MKVKKLIGLVLYKCIGNYLPKPDSKLRILGIASKKFRYMCAKMMFDKCGRNVNLCNKATVSTRIEIGDNSGIGHRANITGKCIIGSNVIMAPECSIFTTNHNIDRVDIPIKYQGSSEERAVVIQDDVWIGYRVIILPGVEIGRGAVIGAGAVVSRNVPDYAVVVGNPARIVKYRNQQEANTKAGE